MRIHRYESNGGKDLILDYIDRLNTPEKVDGYAVMESLEAGRFDELAIKTWRGKISEVYFYKHNRLFYVIADGENMYLLHACRKQKNKTEKNDEEKIIKRAKELGLMLSKKFI